VATPLNNSLRYSTRRNLQGLVYSLPEPERVYRRRINKLAPRRLLESLGEEAISDIHHMFSLNNPTTTNPTSTMGDLLTHVILQIFKVLPMLFLTNLLRSCLLFKETMLLVPYLTS
jgi:hypothetical protein